MKHIPADLKTLIKKAIKEDIGSGDITTLATIPQSDTGSLVLVAKQQGIVCGLAVFSEVFKLLDSSTKIRLFKKDGDRIRAGEQVAVVSGNLRALLSGERVALNFLQRLSGIATYTRRFVDAARPYPLKIYDTRKTTPLWRSLEKYAVRIGGAYNHRFGLYDMILIKDNHIDACGGIVEAVNRARAYHRSRRLKVKIGVEVRTIRELRSVIPLKVDLILVDNMPISQIRRVVELLGGANRPELEVSGGITLRKIRRLAELGVRRISIGALTHSAPAMDFSLKLLSK